MDRGLGGRNTLLYYRDLKQGTLDVSPEADVNQLAVDELLGSRTVRLSNIFGDDALPTAARRARTVRAKATENYEERGLETLFLAWGMATWTNTRGTATPAAPVLLRQARLNPRGGAAEDFDLTLPGEWEVNPTLVRLLEVDFSVKVHPDDLLDLLEEGGLEEPDPAAVFDRLEKAASGAVPGFSVASRVVLGNFSYAKLPMVKDLEVAGDTLLASALICAIAGDTDARQVLRDRHPDVSLNLDPPIHYR